MEKENANLRKDLFMSFLDACSKANDVKSDVLRLEKLVNKADRKINSIFVSEKKKDDLCTVYNALLAELIDAETEYHEHCLEVLKLQKELMELDEEEEAE